MRRPSFSSRSASSRYRVPRGDRIQRPPALAPPRHGRAGRLGQRATGEQARERCLDRRADRSAATADISACRLRGRRRRRAGRRRRRRSAAAAIGAGRRRPGAQRTPRPVLPGVAVQREPARAAPREASPRAPAMSTMLLAAGGVEQQLDAGSGGRSRERSSEVGGCLCRMEALAGILAEVDALLSRGERELHVARPERDGGTAGKAPHQPSALPSSRAASIPPSSSSAASASLPAGATPHPGSAIRTGNCSP